MSEVGDKLRRIRLEKGLTMKDVADAAQIAQSSLSYIEKGVNSPSIDTLKAILNSLGVSLQEFFAEPSGQSAPTNAQTQQARDLLERLNNLPPRERKAVELLLRLDEQAAADNY